MKRAIDAIAMRFSGGGLGGLRRGAAQQEATAAAAAATRTEPRKTASEKNGTGVVPPGVKLDPQMPGGGRAEAVSFSPSGDENAANGLRFLWSPITSSLRSPRSW